MISIEQWLQWNDSNQYSCYPYAEAFDLPETPIGEWSAMWKEAGETSIVLESGRGGRYSFIAPRVKEWISGDLEQGNLFSAETGDRKLLKGPPLQVLREWMASFRSPKAEGVPKFLGGIAGYLAYDVVRTLEKLPQAALADSPIPDYFFMRIEELWIIDHKEHKLICAVHALCHPQEGIWSRDELIRQYEACGRRARSMLDQWNSWMGADSASREASKGTHQAKAASADLHIDVHTLPGLTMSLPAEPFQEAVRKIQQYISQGDVFQVNLSVRQSRALSAAPEQVYETLRRINPSPYMGFLKLPGNKAIVSASPELLIRLEDGRLSTRPIAGTRPRGLNQQEDEELQQELLLNEKERAEHVMLVDLERNDIGRIAAYGSVRVKDFMVVEHYSHVMHIVSEVEGDLATGKDAFDAIAAVFPGGTITGAPKIRTMEIIEELEPVRRGAYTGSIGWIDYNGNMELNITIRTLVYSEGTAHVQSGAGIVIDSVPENEFRESLNKAKALWKAVEISERSRGEKEEFS